MARCEIPAVTHVDHSARVQTVHADTNPPFSRASRRRPVAPVLVNSSFDVLVCGPEDAFRCFMGSEIELPVVGNCMLRKNQQNPALKLATGTISNQID